MPSKLLAAHSMNDNILNNDKKPSNLVELEQNKNVSVVPKLLPKLQKMPNSLKDESKGSGINANAV